MTDWLSPSNLISFYGALLSTGILVWQLIEKRNLNKGDIVVKMYPKVIALTYPNHLGEWTPQLAFDITNKGKNDRFITTAPKLEVKIPGKKNMFLSLLFINPLVPVTYPKKLSPGEIIDPFFELKQLLVEFKNGNAKKVRGYVQDTMGKTYYSKWLDVQELKDYVSRNEE